jgi:hypothetical protein
VITVESTRRFRNSGRIEYFWDQQEKKKKSFIGRKKLLQFCGSKYVMARWVSQRKECLHVASVVGDVVA